MAVAAGIVLLAAYLVAFTYEFCAPIRFADPARRVRPRAADRASA